MLVDKRQKKPSGLPNGGGILPHKKEVLIKNFEEPLRGTMPCFVDMAFFHHPRGTNSKITHEPYYYHKRYPTSTCCRPIEDEPPLNRY